MRMEPDLNHLMETSRDEALLKGAWTSWHQHIGTEAKPLYTNLVRLLNQGARQAGNVICFYFSNYIVVKLEVS